MKFMAGRLRQSLIPGWQVNSWKGLTTVPGLNLPTISIKNSLNLSPASLFGLVQANLEPLPDPMREAQRGVGLSCGVHLLVCQ